MTRVSNRAIARQALLLAIALTVLNVSLAFANIWPTPGVQWHGELSIELALLVFGLAVAAERGWTPGRRFVGGAAIVWVILTIGRYADVTVQSLFGREINLYWDSRHFSAVGAMLAFVARPWLILLIVAAIVVIPLLLFLPARWALRVVSGAMSHARPRRTLAALAAVTLVLAVIQHREEPFTELPQFSTPVTPVFAHQAKSLALEVTGINRHELAAAPSIDSDFSRVQGADVFVVFLESYGASSYDRPEYLSKLVPARERLAASIRESGRDVVSAYAESPTFGGSSWLAHVSLLSGTEVRDGDTNMRLMAQPGRDTLVTAFRRHGYHSVAVMPGLQQAWPEGKFYGFDEIYGVSQLNYQGPGFGWWDVTDQYAVAKMDALAVQRTDRAPLFVFFPTISTHTPFTPVPPYQPNWARMLEKHPYEPALTAGAWDEQPNWMNLGPGYTKALSYSFDTLGGYLRLRHDRDFVVVLLGDHQPPSVVSGEGASWEVPVHVIASRKGLLDRLVQRGFQRGLQPAHPAVSRIDGLMPILLDAFGDREGD
jgi:hypothetical protein